MLETAEFWVFVSLCVFLAVAGKKGWYAMATILDQRTENIKNQISQAEHLLKQAQTMFATYQQKQEEAIDHSIEIVSHSENEAMELKRSTEHELAHQMVIKEESCTSRIAQLRDEAKYELSSYLVEEALRIVQLALQDQKITGNLVHKNVHEMLKDADLKGLAA